MPRVRALFLLGMFVVNQAACTSWQIPKVTPKAYAAEHPDKSIRITLDRDGGSYHGNVVLKGVRFSGDSVFGRDPDGQPLAFSLQQVTAIEVRRADGVRTGLWVTVPFAVLGALWGFALLDCSSDPDC